MNALRSELRPLRAILGRLAERPLEAPVGETMSTWCTREHIVMAQQTTVHAAAESVTQIYFTRSGCRVQ
jgi:hypothetical protein